VRGGRRRRRLRKHQLGACESVLQQLLVHFRAVCYLGFRAALFAVFIIIIIIYI
jgi:hypothetical protein